jgi:hypothetical protein
MKALSIRQPYAWLIANGIKDVENRTWRTAFRGQVLIHAGKTYPKRDFADDHDCYLEAGYPTIRESMIGGIVGVARIVACVTSSSSKWWIGPVGLMMTEAKPLRKLVPCNGELGFFDVPPDVFAEVIEQLPPGTFDGEDI